MRTGKRQSRTTWRRAYEALGLAAMVRKKYDDAATQFESAVTASPDPATMVRLAAAYNLAKKPDQALATLDKLNATPDLHPSIKAVAAQERNNAVKLKGGAASGCCQAGNTRNRHSATTPAPRRANSRPRKIIMPAADLQELEAKLGHTFRDRNLLVRALTHRSFAFGAKSEDPTYSRQ